MDRLFTIGAYGSETESFFAALRSANVDVFLDLRRRRGIRGSQYSYGNARKLEAGLLASGIAYRHLLELAPTASTRELQNEADEKSGLPKRQRALLSGKFVEEYTRSTLQPFNWSVLIEELSVIRHPVLFCVERTPEACHRGLVAAKLVDMTGIPVTHLMP